MHSAWNSLRAIQISSQRTNGPQIRQILAQWTKTYGCSVGGLLQAKTKLKTITKLKEALQVIWNNLPQGPIDKAVKNI